MLWGDCMRGVSSASKATFTKSRRVPADAVAPLRGCATLERMARATRGPDGKPIRSFRDRRSWAAWLEKNHALPGVWLRLAKKSSNQKSISYDDAVEVALCYGWIDGQSKGEDEDRRLQKFTPRARRSNWSKRNRERALALIESGRMKPAGLMEIERAKQDGRWVAAYDPPSTMNVPRDFQAALNKEARAKAFFTSLDGRTRYAVLFQLQTAKRPETRARRIERFVAMLAREEKL
jgi:uncharacterized protein YdeI (YjbR/CyaY-like superfamily)